MTGASRSGEAQADPALGPGGTTEIGYLSIGSNVGDRRANLQSAVDLLPPYARTMLGLQRPLVGALPARMATRTMSETLRWAFRQR